ncbi:MAG: TonB-dependent receptor [Vicinamibacteria bacterium]|nr:TonB-dependent receptor [Vicinamibacteria bacterium]
MPSRARAAVVALIVAFASPLAAAASLSGRLASASGDPVPQVVIELRGDSTVHRAVTGPDGRYRFDGLAIGRYAVTADTPGFQLSTTPAAQLATADAVVALDLTLQPAPVRESVVVSATRGEAAPSTLGVSVDTLDREAIAARAPSDLLHLLQEMPGVAVARTGGLGTQASAFVRGGESRYARVLVDGVPVNQPGGAYDFGMALPLELERLEVVRGAASALYGTDAIAGVIALETRRARAGEAFDFRAAAETGTFETSRFEGGTSGASGPFDWNLGALHVESDNEEPNSAFEETAAAASLGARFSPATDLRVVLRAMDSRAGTPGQTAYGRPDLDAFIERDEWLLGATLNHRAGAFVHTLRVGYHDGHQLSENPEDSGFFQPQFEATLGFGYPDSPSADGFLNDNRRLSAGYQLERGLGGRHLVSLGADLERETGDVGRENADDFVRPERTNVGAWVQDRVVLGSRAFLTVGGRVEHNDSYGTEVVPRAALAWRLRGGDDATTLRTSFGRGIKEPTFLESFGASVFAQGNPDLLPERSTTFDLGVEQRFAADRARLALTAFRHDYFDQIGYAIASYVPFRGTYLNIGESRAQGLEVALAAAPRPFLTLAAQYTFLDSEVVKATSDFDPVYAQGEPLLRRPRHSGTVTVTATPGRLTAGLTLALVGERADSDFAGLGLTRNPGYARLDARLRYVVGAGISVFAAGENLTDAEYEEVLGYPALGRAVRFGLRFSPADRP